MHRWCRLSVRHSVGNDRSNPVQLVRTTTGLPVLIEVQGIIIEGALTSLGDLLW